MSNTKTEAQRLADFAKKLSDEGPMIHTLSWPQLSGACQMFSDELLRLDAENQQLRAQLDQAVQQYKKDAERYHKLFEAMDEGRVSLIVEGASKSIDGGGIFTDMDDAFDAIDAAIRARSNT